VAAVLGDALHRVCSLGGRDGMLRSLGSVYGGSVSLFLGGILRCRRRRVVKMPAFLAISGLHGIAATRDGRSILLSDSFGGTHAIHEIGVADHVHCSWCRVIEGSGDGPLRFGCPRQVYVAPDGFVFVADSCNNRVQVLTPDLAFHCFIGDGEVDCPVGVCANADVVVVSEDSTSRISVFNRSDGSLTRRLALAAGSSGRTACALHGVCFTSGDRHIAVADAGNHWHRVTARVLTVDGAFVRHVGVGVLSLPVCIAASACGDELVVVDGDSRRAHVFSDIGDLLATLSRGSFTGAAVFNGGIVLQDGPHEFVVFGGV
jgi:DNA-binding beta-propeller fold protein YncE